MVCVSMFGFFENAKMNNLTDEGWDKFQEHILTLCDLAGIDYDMSFEMQLEMLKDKR